MSDEGLDPSDEANRRLLFTIPSEELAGTAVLNISQRREPHGFYDKEVQLVTFPLEPKAPAEIGAAA